MLGFIHKDTFNGIVCVYHFEYCLLRLVERNRVRLAFEIIRNWERGGIVTTPGCCQSTMIGETLWCGSDKFWSPFQHLACAWELARSFYFKEGKNRIVSFLICPVLIVID